MRRIPRRVWFESAAFAGIGFLVSLLVLAGNEHSAFGRLLPGPNGRFPVDQFHLQEYFDASVEPPVVISWEEACRRAEEDPRRGYGPGPTYRVVAYGFAFPNEGVLAPLSVTRSANVQVDDFDADPVDPKVASRLRTIALEQLAASDPETRRRYLVPQFVSLPLEPLGDPKEPWICGQVSARWTAPHRAGYVHDGLIVFFFVVCVGSSILAFRAGPRADGKGVGAGGTTLVSE